jgi:hypothetical protein
VGLEKLGAPFATNLQSFGKVERAGPSLPGTPNHTHTQESDREIGGVDVELRQERRFAKLLARSARISNFRSPGSHVKRSSETLTGEHC